MSSDELKELEIVVYKTVELMSTEIFKHFDDNYNEFNPELVKKYKFLKSTIKEQKDENANLFMEFCIPYIGLSMIPGVSEKTT